MLKTMKSTSMIRTEVTNKKVVKKELKKYGIKNYIEGLEPYKKWNLPLYRSIFRRRKNGRRHM